MAKNHYVSQLIIKRFAPSVTTFDVNKRSVIENRQAHKIFYKNDIYTNEVEKKLAHELEQPFARLLDEKILHTDKIVLTRKDMELLKQFLLLDSVRTYEAQDFLRVLSNFKNNAEKYFQLQRNFNDFNINLPSVFDLDLCAEAIQMRAMQLFLDCKNTGEIMRHPLATRELYCWAKVNYDSYVAFWDSDDDQEFILTSTGMVSEYEPSHAIFEGLDLSKYSYLLDKLGCSNSERRAYYAHLLSFNQIMYENFNIFNLSSNRCMVLVHPFFKLYSGAEQLINFKKVMFEAPEIWPTCFENKNLVAPPQNHYKCLMLGFTDDDIFEYIPQKLSFWETVYLNGLILSQTHEIIGYNDISKVVDTFTFVNLLNSLSDRKLYRLSGLEALDRWIDNILNDKFHYIFRYYKDLELTQKEDIGELIDKFADLKWRDIRKNKYVLKYLLSNQEKLRTIDNFKFIGSPDQVVNCFKTMLKELGDSDV